MIHCILGFKAPKSEAGGRKFRGRDYIYGHMMEEEVEALMKLEKEELQELRRGEEASIQKRSSVFSVGPPLMGESLYDEPSTSEKS